MKKILSFLLGFLSVGIIFLCSSIVMADSTNEGTDGGETTTTTTDNPIETQGGAAGINFSEDCLKKVGSNCFDYEEFLGINTNATSGRTAMTVLQDVVLGVTYAVGTIFVIVLLYCGFMYILSANNNASKAANLKKGMINAGIGALLVRGAYLIVRFIQYVAKDGGVN